MGEHKTDIPTREKYLEALRYSAHLSKLLVEACTILEKLELTVEVSEPLQFFWEKKKRAQEAALCRLVTPKPPQV